MSYEAYRYIFIVGAAMAALMLIVTVVLFFVLKIGKVVGYLSGMSAKKEIKKFEQNNTPRDTNNESIIPDLKLNIDFNGGEKDSARTETTEKLSSSPTADRATEMLDAYDGGSVNSVAKFTIITNAVVIHTNELIQ